MPERFLLQILRSLVTHGVLRSTRGVDGGYCLEKSASDTSLLDVIEAVEGPLTTNVPNGRLPTEMSNRLHAALEKVEALGARREQVFENPEHGSAAFCGDPFGHGFCLIARKAKQ